MDLKNQGQPESAYAAFFWRPRIDRRVHSRTKNRSKYVTIDILEKRQFFKQTKVGLILQSSSQSNLINQSIHTHINSLFTYLLRVDVT